MGEILIAEKPNLDYTGEMANIQRDRDTPYSHAEGFARCVEREKGAERNLLARAPITH
jgi:hypothetical protein